MLRSAARHVGRKPARVVLSYRHRSYSPPDIIEASLVTAQVTHDPGLGLPHTNNLQALRDELLDLGFRLLGKEVDGRNLRTGVRFNPMWREVWILDRVPALD
jgi:hypothetical protein